MSEKRTAIDTEGAAKRISALGVPMSVTTLKRRRTKGGGPPYVRIGAKALYPIDQIDAWVKEQIAVQFHSVAEEEGNGQHDG